MQALVYKPHVHKSGDLWVAWLYSPYGLRIAKRNTWHEAVEVAVENAWLQLMGITY